MPRHEMDGESLLAGFKAAEGTQERPRSPRAEARAKAPSPLAADSDFPKAAYVAVASVGILSILGLVMIYSASALPGSLPGGNGEFHFVRKQFLFLLVSLVALAAAFRMPWRWVERSGTVLYGLTALALVLVLVPGLGTEFNGARRWFRIEGFGLQVSDVAKIALILFLARHLGRDPGRTRTLLRGALPAMAAVGLLAGLVVIEPDFGTALFLVALGGTLAIAGGLRWIHLAPPLAAGLAAMAFTVWQHFDHVRDRVAVFLDPTLDPLGKGHQVRQSLIALGSGGLFGNGLGASRQKLFFLPEDFTDFIFALVGEELGLIGTLLVLACFLAFALAALSIAKRARSETAYLVALGAAVLVGLQGFINVAVVTASAPTKGISLPFVSYGSSLVVMMAALGLLLNVARRPRDGATAAPARTPGVSPEGAPAPA